jgi:hypothetical protein
VWCWPGNTVDSALLRQVKDDMRDWTLAKIAWVAGRGFSSAENRRYLRKGGCHYIIGEKLRSGSAEAAAAPSRQGRYQDVAANLRVKKVRISEDPAVRDLLQPRGRRARRRRQRPGVSAFVTACWRISSSTSPLARPLAPAAPITVPSDGYAPGLGRVPAAAGHGDRGSELRKLGSLGALLFGGLPPGGSSPRLAPGDLSRDERHAIHPVHRYQVTARIDHREGQADTAPARSPSW